MTRVNTMEELKQAVKERPDEILVADPVLAHKTKTWNTIRTVANILVFVILGLALFAWADPLHWQFLKSDGARLGRQIMLGFGLALLFIEYVLPIARHYKIASEDENGLKLTLRRRK